MVSSKHIDKICIIITALTLVLTILFMCGEQLGIAVYASTPAYESTLFDTSYVHQIDIVMNDWESFIATCENEEYASCTVVIDGEKYGNIAIRAKGNTSLSTVSSLGSSRYSFKLEFDHYESGKSMDGLDKLCLNNLIQDNTMMKDYLVYSLMADFGVDSPLCSYAYLTVNGEDWGLYLAVEGVEDSFLSRNYANDDGELYKPDSMSFGGGRGNGKDFDMDDFDFDFDTDTFDFGFDTDTESGTTPSFPFNMGGIDGTVPTMPSDVSGMGGTMFTTPSDMSGTSGTVPTMPSDMGDMGGGMSFGSEDVKLQYIDDDPESYSNIFDNAKTEVSEADKERLIASLKKLSSYEDLETVLDTDSVLRYFVVHNFVCNGDSYTGSMVHNYYLYESDGRLSMIPWDYNLAFGTFQGGDASGTVNTSIDSPVSGGSADDRPMVGWIFSDESYTEAYHTLFAEFIEKWFTYGEMETLIADTAEMIAPYVEKDPTKFCTTEEFEAGVEALTRFVCLRAEAVSCQLAGDTTAVNTDGLSLSDMGTMNNGGNMGGDMGGNMGEFSGGGAMPATPTDMTSKTQGGTMPDMGKFGGNGQGGMNTMPGGMSTESGTELQSDSLSFVYSDAPSAPVTAGGSMGSAFPGMGNGGTMPDMSNSGGNGQGGMGTIPGNMGDIGDFSGGGTVPSTQTDMTDKTQGGTVPDMGDTDGKGDFSPDLGSNTSSSEMTEWLWVGVSVLILGVGILIAVKKKI